MNNKFFSVMYAINIVSQAIFTLLFPAALGFGIAYLSIRFLSAPTWLYAILIPLGIILGFVSMVKFVISAMAALERLEKQNDKNENTGNNINDRSKKQ